MKKKNLACLALAAPLFALTACTGGTSSLALSSNWYARVDSKIAADTHEELTYSVTFEAEDGNTFLTYDEGTYTTTLETVTIELADGTQELCYHLTSELTIPVKFTVGDEERTFEDHVLSEVWFRDAIERSLQPVRSEKTVLSHSPSGGEAPASIDDAYTVYEYTYISEYDANCANVKIDVAYTQPEVDPRSYDVELTGSGTYLDNEEILFALRGVSMSSAATFRSVNPVKRAVENVAMTAAPTSSSEKLTFSINGESAERELTAYSFSLAYSGNNPGQAQDLTYAGVTSANDNTYRSVLLSMKVPILYSLGTLRYTLSSAIF